MSPYCHCGKKFTDGGIDTTNPKQYWQLCATCGKPSHVVQKKEPDIYAPHPEAHMAGVVIGTDGISTTLWVMPSGDRIKTINYLPYPRRGQDMSHGRDQLLTFWKALDDQIDHINHPPEGTDSMSHYEAKVRARTYCEVLAHLMVGYYEDSNAVGHEAMARYSARVAGTEHITPGLAEHIWNPASRWDGTVYSTESLAKVRSDGATTKPIKTLPDNKVAFIKHSLETGTIPADELATMFNVSMDTIQACVS